MDRLIWTHSHMEGRFMMLKKAFLPLTAAVTVVTVMITFQSWPSHPREINQIEIRVEPNAPRQQSADSVYLTIHPVEEKVGRLGNFCFRYAAALGIAAANDFVLILPDNEYTRQMREMFSLSAMFDTEIGGASLQYQDFKEAHWGKFDERTMNMTRKNTRLVWSYTQAWRYFHTVEEQVRQELSLSSTLKKYANEAITALKQKHKIKTVIGLHVRRGDFLKPGFAQFGYATAPAEFFHLAIQWYHNNIGTDILFLVASDDIPWCIANINGTHGAKIEFSQNRTAAEDFSLLLSSDHHIVSTGSFGWWAAWLSRGMVLYYKDFPTPGSPHSKNHNPQDYYPEHWLALP